MERKIMKPLDQYEIDWDIDLGTWDVNHGTWDVNHGTWDIDKTMNNNTMLKGKKGTHATETDTLLKDTPPPTTPPTTTKQ